jgi:predicted nucleic acid-binding protein
MMNKLADFPAVQPIFIDANIWTYFALNTEPFQTSCAAFLYRVEVGQITAITSTAVLNETFYAILVGKAAAELQTTKIKQIHRQLMQDNEFTEACYQVCGQFAGYLQGLMQAGLQMLPLDYQTQITALELGARYRLLPTDALHVATCQRYEISHIAAADAHFERVPFLHIWGPDNSTPDL